MSLVRDSFHTDKSVLAKYLQLPQHDDHQYMYVWIDGTGEHLRAKTRTIKGKIDKPEGKSNIILIKIIFRNNDTSKIGSNRK